MVIKTKTKFYKNKFVVRIKHLNKRNRVLALKEQIADGNSYDISAKLIAADQSFHWLFSLKGYNYWSNVNNIYYQKNIFKSNLYFATAPTNLSERIIKNQKKQNIPINISANMLDENSFFCWENSTEGFDYWFNIFLKYKGSLTTNEINI